MLGVVERARGFLVDLDGTLIRGRGALPHARDLLAAIDGRFVVLSNDAEHTPDQLARLLRALRLPVPADRIVLAGAVALELLAAERTRTRLMLLASPVLRTYARRLGLDLVDSDPDVVFLGRDRQFSFRKLAAAANAVRAGAELIVANPDRTHPGPHGAIVPETGAILSAMLACTGPVPYRIIGKPQPALFRKALTLLGSRPEETLMIGDNFETDGLGAAAAGIRFVHIDAWTAERQDDASAGPSTTMELAGS